MSEEPPIDRRKPSTIPSWVMIGFVVGVLVMLGFRADWGRDNTETAGAPEEASAPIATEAPATVATEANDLAMNDRPSFSVVEALFEQYREYAFWERDRTEIAVWNTRALGFTDYFEVLRTDTGTYFRSIPELTRLPLENYAPPDCPLLFTETAPQRAARYQKERGAERRREPRPPPIELPTIPPPP